MRYYDVRGVIAEGMAMSEDIKQTNLNKSIHLQEITGEWYKNEEYDPMCVLALVAGKERFDNV